MERKENSEKELINLWATAINAADIEAVVKLYSPGAILIPSMSNELKKNAKQIKEYLAYLLAKDRFKVEILEHVSQKLEDITVASGIYIFSWNIKNKLHKVSARFTLVIQNGLIMQHHSSVAPE